MHHKSFVTTTQGYVIDNSKTAFRLICVPCRRFVKYEYQMNIYRCSMCMAGITDEELYNAFVPYLNYAKN